MNWKFILFFLVTIQSYSQTNNIQYLSFKHEYSGIVRDDVLISFSFSENFNYVTVKYSIKNKTRHTKKIPAEKFDAICLVLKQVSIGDLMDNFSFGLDLPTTIVSFGEIPNDITLRIWGLDSDTVNKPTGYIKFIEAIEMILATIDTSLDEINK